MSDHLVVARFFTLPSCEHKVAPFSEGSPLGNVFSVRYHHSGLIVPLIRGIS